VSDLYEKDKDKDEKIKEVEEGKLKISLLFL
jgi:hypothetical protein